jgi:DNA-binding protein HU-beta
MTLTTNALIQTIADGCFSIEGYKTNEAKKESLDKGKLAVKGILSAIQSALAAGEPVRLIGFGMFSVKSVSEKKGRNPRTGDVITIKAYKRIGFKPGKFLKEAVNEEEKPNSLKDAPKVNKKVQSKATVSKTKK